MDFGGIKNTEQYNLTTVNLTSSYLNNSTNDILSNFNQNNSFSSDYYVQFQWSATNVCYLIIGLFGFILNGFVITVITVHKPMHNQMANVYIANQNLIDIFVAAFIFLNIFTVNNANLKAGNVADELLCRVLYTRLPLWGMLDSSTYNIVALTYERYIAIVHPIWHKTTFSNNRLIVGIAIACVWLIGPAFNAAYRIPTAAIAESGACLNFAYYATPTAKTAASGIVLVFEYFLPLILITYGYSKIGWVLHKRVRVTTQTPKVGKGTINCRSADHREQLGRQGGRDVRLEKEATWKETEIMKEGRGRGGVKARGGGGVREKENGGILDAEDTSTRARAGEAINTPVAGEIRKNESLSKAKRNVLRTSAMIAFFFVLCWSGTEIYFLAYNLGDTSTPSLYVTVTKSMMYMSCCINPIIYSLTNFQFKQGAASVFARTKISRIADSSSKRS